MKGGGGYHSLSFASVGWWALERGVRGSYFLEYPAGHFGLVPVTFFVVLPFTHEIVIFLGVANLGVDFGAIASSTRFNFSWFLVDFPDTLASSKVLPSVMSGNWVGFWSCNRYSGFAVA